MKEHDAIITVNHLNLHYGEHHALKEIEVGFARHKVTALIGPSGCGKSTLLRCLNRMNDLVENVRIEGEVRFEGTDIYAPEVDVVEIRKQIGMVFQRPNPFPKSIYENVAYGPRVHGVRDRSTLDAVVEKSLRDAALWDEVKDRCMLCVTMMTV